MIIVKQLKFIKFIITYLFILISGQIYADNVNVAVASNFNAPMKHLVNEFEKISKHKVKLSFGSSGKIYAQIRHGAPFHVFFSADQAKPIKLEKAKLIKMGSRFTYAIGGLALWSVKDNFLDNPQKRLQSGEFNRLAIANPKLAPYGAAAVQVLENLGLKKETQKKWVQGENIAQTFQFVATRNADLGFIAISQIIQSSGFTGSRWIVPTEFYEPIRQDAVILEKGESNHAAIEFVQFVKQKKAQQIIESYGYKVR